MSPCLFESKCYHCRMFASLSLVIDSSATLVIDRKINTSDFTIYMPLSFQTVHKQHKFFFPGRLSSVLFSLLHFAVCLSLNEEDVVQ